MKKKNSSSTLLFFWEIGCAYLQMDNLYNIIIGLTPTYVRCNINFPLYINIVFFILVVMQYTTLNFNLGMHDSTSTITMQINILSLILIKIMCQKDKSIIVK